MPQTTVPVQLITFWQLSDVFSQSVRCCYVHSAVAAVNWESKYTRTYGNSAWGKQETYHNIFFVSPLSCSNRSGCSYFYNRPLRRKLLDPYGCFYVFPLQEHYFICYKFEQSCQFSFARLFYVEEKQKLKFKGNPRYLHPVIDGQKFFSTFHCRIFIWNYNQS